MLICTECGFVFDEGTRYTEPHGEVTYGCPKCDSTSIEEADKCDCGNPKERSEWLCKSCRTALQRKFTRFWTNLTRDEKEFVLELMEEF